MNKEKQEALSKLLGIEDLFGNEDPMLNLIVTPDNENMCYYNNRQYMILEPSDVRPMLDKNIMNTLYAIPPDIYMKHSTLSIEVQPFVEAFQFLFCQSDKLDYANDVLKNFLFDNEAFLSDVIENVSTGLLLTSEDASEDMIKLNDKEYWIYTYPETKY